MRNGNTVLLIAIVILTLICIYVILPNGPGLHFALGPFEIDRDFALRQGLDLQGGVRVMLEADLEPGQKLDDGAIDVSAQIIENRVNALGVTEPLVQTLGDQRIVVELPGIKDPDQAIATIKETGLLEFIDAGSLAIPAGTFVQTTYPLLESQGARTHSVEPSPTEVAPPESSITETITSPLEIEPPEPVVPEPEPTTGEPESGTLPEEEPVTPGPAITDQVFATVLTGAHLQNAAAQRNEQTGELMIAFELTEEGGRIFEEYTGRNIGRFASIVLDKEVISSPRIESQIPGGRGVIQGQFTPEQAQSLVVQLRYGALPVPLRVETTQAIGPTLGQDSVQRSIQAGTVGLIIVLLFMLIYYRLPGFLADLALILYGLINLAIYMVGWPTLLIISLLLLLSYLLEREDVWPLILGSILLLGTFALAVSGFTGVTLTLPAITGFILSTGMAVDANILVFERVKEELRAGRGLTSAIEAGFNRAWTSIRDSNISTLITCAILYYFGSAFGAGAVRGFAITLALGVLINMFTAITVTRTLMRFVFRRLGDKLASNDFLLGV